MKRITAIVLAVVFMASFAATCPAPAAEPAADRVVAMYFHRTQRCPTCKKMGSYAEEAVKKAFAKEIKSGTVAYYYIDFQDQKNAKLTKGYQVSGPALIVAKIANNKVVKYKDLEKIWENVADKPAFLKYVQDNLVALRK